MVNELAKPIRLPYYGINFKLTSLRYTRDNHLARSDLRDVFSEIEAC